MTRAPRKRPAALPEPRKPPPDTLREDFAALKQKVHDMSGHQQTRIAAEAIGAKTGPNRLSMAQTLIAIAVGTVALGGVVLTAVNSYSSAQVQGAAVQAQLASLNTWRAEQAAIVATLRDKMAAAEQTLDTGRRLNDQRFQALNDQAASLRQSDAQAAVRVESYGPLLAAIQAQLVEIRRWQEAIDRRLDRSGYVPPAQRQDGEIPTKWIAPLFMLPDA